MRSLRAVVLKSVVVQTRTHLKCVSEPDFKSKLSGFLPCMLAGTSGHCCLLGLAEGRDGAASAQVLSSGETGQCLAYSSLPEPPLSLRSAPWGSPPSSSWWAGGRGTVSAPAWDLPTRVRVSGFTGGSWCRPQAPGGGWSLQSGSLLASPALPNQGCKLDRTLGPLVPIPSLSEEENKACGEKSFMAYPPTLSQGDDHLHVYSHSLLGLTLLLLTRSSDNGWGSPEVRPSVAPSHRERCPSSLGPQVGPIDAGAVICVLCPEGRWGAELVDMGLCPGDLNLADIASGPSWGLCGVEGAEPVECCGPVP